MRYACSKNSRKKRNFHFFPPHCNFQYNHIVIISLISLERMETWLSDSVYHDRIYIKAMKLIQHICNHCKTRLIHCCLSLNIPQIRDVLLTLEFSFFPLSVSFNLSLKFWPLLETPRLSAKVRTGLRVFIYTCI